MSLVSQTPRRVRLPLNHSVLVSALTIGSVLTVSLTPVRRFVMAAALNAHPHGPDWALLGRLSPVIKIHLAAALGALVLGAVLMVVRKGRTFHRIAGWAWVSLVFTVAGASLFITSLNHGRWSLLHLFTAWTLLILPMAVFWARRRNVARHRRAMMGLFYGGFAVNLIVAFIPGRTLWNVFFG